MHIPESIAEEMEGDEREKKEGQEEEVGVTMQGGKRRSRKKKEKKETDLPRIHTGVNPFPPLIE